MSRNSGESFCVNLRTEGPRLVSPRSASLPIDPHDLPRITGGTGDMFPVHVHST